MRAELLLFTCSNLGLSRVHRILQQLDHVLRAWVVEDSSSGDDNVAACRGSSVSEQTFIMAFVRRTAPAWAQTSIVFGPTPPSTSMSFSGNRARSSATLHTHRSKNFWPPRPVHAQSAVSTAALPEEGAAGRTGVDGHDEQHVGGLADLICDRCRGRVRRDRDAGLHLAPVDGVDEAQRVGWGARTTRECGAGGAAGDSLTRRLEVEAVERAACVRDVVDPLCGVRARQRGAGDGERAGVRAFSGWATIIWQSMNMPGTPFETHESTGAPAHRGLAQRSVEAAIDNAPMVMLGTKWLRGRSAGVDAKIRERLLPIHDICGHSLSGCRCG